VLLNSTYLLNPVSRCCFDNQKCSKSPLANFTGQVQHVEAVSCHSSNELPLRRHADRRSHLVLFAEVDCEVDGAVVSEWRDGRRDPAGPVGGIVEVGHQTWRVTAAGPRRVADRRVQVAARCGRTVVLSPATPPPTSPRTPSNTLRLHLASRRFCAYRHLGLGLK